MGGLTVVEVGLAVQALHVLGQVAHVEKAVVVHLR